MKILTAEKIREADAYTIKHEPVASIDLMERAAHQLLEWMKVKYSSDEEFKIFVGPGNNGGDGWALARLLSVEGYKQITVYLLDLSGKLSLDANINRKRLSEHSHVKVLEIKNPGDFPKIGQTEIVIDALFGSGLSRPLDGLAAGLVEHINIQDCKGLISVDIPSGLFSNGSNQQTEHRIIRANYTLSFQFPKLSFFFSENEEYVGEWNILPIGLHPEFIEEVDTPYFYPELSEIQNILIPRHKFSHKGTYGHALLIAGSYGMMGAAVLSAKAAVRAGVGLLTSHVPRLGVDVVQSTVPESLISIDESDLLFSGHPDLESFTAVGIGPGLNQKTNTRKGLIALLESIKVPVVIDADGLNILSKTENWPDLLPVNAVLTPHPKEFERLFGSFPDSYTRLERQIAFSKKHKCVIVLKGANTCISDPSGKAYFNPTGNPGMAKGGCGDVLTGIILGLLAQGYSCTDAAKLGVFVHGMAGDIGADSFGLTGLVPSDLIDNIGRAFYVLEKRNK